MESVATTSVAAQATTQEHKYEVNDVVQVQDVVADIGFIGLLGYVAKVTDTVITVSLYHVEEKDKNAFVLEKEFLKSEIFFVGRPNSNLLPN